MTVTKTMDDINFADFAAVPGPVDLSVLPGLQDKVTASYRHDKDPTRAYILKFNDGSHQHQVETEHLLLTKARALSIPVADARLVHDGVGQAALLVSRFDRSPADRWRWRTARSCWVWGPAANTRCPVRPWPPPPSACVLPRPWLRETSSCSSFLRG
ncbi:HipA domain-containing protein [Arthrobacter alpinus]|nr:HipA domain-containing protein [Arthrobacter alpinus]